MASLPTTPAPPPQSLLLGLPTEIKAHIVKLVRRQDVAYKERMRWKGKRQEISSLLRSKWYGRGTNALFVVNKDLSSLTAVQLFEASLAPSTKAGGAGFVSPFAQTIKASRWSEDRFFRLCILHRYSRHFCTVEFDSNATPDQLVSLLERATTFSRLHRLDISPDASERLLGKLAPTHFTVEVEEGEHREDLRSILRELGERIDTLSLREFSAPEAAAILEHFPRLAFLDLRLDDLLEPDNNTIRLAHALARLHLRYLHIHLDSIREQLLSWNVGTWASVKTLKRLIICGSYGAGLSSLASDWALVRAFSRTLESLSLSHWEFDELFDPSRDPPLPPTIFPRLHTLRLSAPAGLVASFLTAVAGSPFQKLKLKLDLGEAWGTTRPLAPSSPLFPALALHRSSLRQIYILDSSGPATDHEDRTEAIRTTCADLGITLRSKGTTFFTVSRALPTELLRRQEQTGRICDAVDEVLEFARGRTEGLRRDGDCEGAEEVLGILEGLKALQMAWED